LASLFNAVMGGQTVQAVEVDTMLRQLVYKGSAPATQAPIFAPKSWGEVLEHVIEHASSGAGHVAEPANGDIRPGTLPHEIEVSLSPPLVTLIWRGPDGTVARRDWYGLAKPAPVSGALIRKTVIDGRVINVLADALRASAEGSSAGVRGAERTNAALLPQSTASVSRSRKSPSSPTITKGRVTEKIGCSQGRTTRVPGKFPRKSRSDHVTLRPHTAATGGG